MTLGELKQHLEGLSPIALEQKAVYNSTTYFVSGLIDAFVEAQEDLYYTGDDGSPLYTEKQLKERGYDDEDIEGFDIEIPRGGYYLEF